MKNQCDKVEVGPDYEKGDIKIIGRVELEVDIEMTPYSGGTIAACDSEVITKAIRFGGIDNNIVRHYISGYKNIIRMVEGSAASASIKGKAETSIPDDIDHHLSSMQGVALDTFNTGKSYPISRNNFGFAERIVYGDTRCIPSDLSDKVQNWYLKFRLNELRNGRSK